MIDAPKKHEEPIKKVEEKKPDPVEEEAPVKKLDHVSPPMRRSGGPMNKRGGKVAPVKKAVEPIKKGKQARVWELGGTKADAAALDYSSSAPTKQGNGNSNDANDRESNNLYSQNVTYFWFFHSFILERVHWTI